LYPGQGTVGARQAGGPRDLGGEGAAGLGEVLEDGAAELVHRLAHRRDPRPEVLHLVPGAEGAVVGCQPGPSQHDHGSCL